VEKRLGTATLGVFFVWASAVYTTLLYYETLPLAGKVLFFPRTWMSHLVDTFPPLSPTLTLSAGCRSWRPAARG
jgi:hypothetical protein